MRVVLLWNSNWFPVEFIQETLVDTKPLFTLFYMDANLSQMLILFHYGLYMIIICIKALKEKGSRQLSQLFIPDI